MLTTRSCYVYVYRDPREKWINPETNQEEFKPKLVGKGSGVRDRDHLKETENTTKNRRKFYWIRSLKRQGLEPIIERYQDNLTDDEAFALESDLVVKWGREGYDQGGVLLNVVPGGDGATRTGIPLSEEHRQRISETILRMKQDGTYNEPNRPGWSDPESVKEKLRAAALKNDTPERRKASSERMKHYIQENGSIWQGRQHSDESKRKDHESHQVYRYKLRDPNGTDKEFCSLKELAEHGLNSAGLTKLMRGEWQQYRGWTFVERVREGAGQPTNDEHRAKIVENNRGRQCSESTKEKIAAKISKRYQVTYPDGHVEVITNARKFCREHCLDSGNLLNTANGILGQHKGYKLKRITS